MTMVKRRRTELTQEQRQALEVARLSLAPFFPGETVKLYVPRAPGIDHARAERDRRISAAIASGEAPAVITERESVSKRHVRRIRARFGGHVPP